MLAISEFPGAQRSDRLRPLISADAKPHFDALTQGRLTLQSCRSCGRARFPCGPVCTWCGSAEAEWIDDAGQGQVHSWVRYHRSFMTEFETLIPYVVLAVKLHIGPVLFGRLVDANPTEPQIGMPAQAVVERWADGFSGLAFTLSGGPT